MLIGQVQITCWHERINKWKGIKIAYQEYERVMVFRCCAAAMKSILWKQYFQTWQLWDVWTSTRRIPHSQFWEFLELRSTHFKVTKFQKHSFSGKDGNNMKSIMAQMEVIHILPFHIWGEKGAFLPSPDSHVRTTIIHIHHCVSLKNNFFVGINTICISSFPKICADENDEAFLSHFLLILLLPALVNS